MSFSDFEEEFGCTNVYLCKKCDDAKPRRDFYKEKEEMYYKTCKECRDKVKSTRETSEFWLKWYITEHYAWDDSAEENKETAYKRYAKWTVNADKPKVTQKKFQFEMEHVAQIDCFGDYYTGIAYSPDK